MKLGLLTSTTFLALFSVVACASSTQTKIGDPAVNPDGTLPTDETPAAEAEDDDVANQPPHSLGTIVLGEAHGSGASTKSTPIVSATFLPDAMLGRSCKKKLDAGCEIQEVAKCTKVSTSTSGCNSNEACVLDNATCKAVCKPYAVCEKSCDEDEICKPASTGSTTSTAGTCVKREFFDAGPLAFSGTTTSITLYPPYKFESSGSQGAPFLGGAELRVQASGATEAGFEKFDEKFTATTFLQTTPSLAKIPREKIFGTGSVPIAWAPANDTIVITVSGAGGSATCKVKDSAGKFDIPRSVVKAAQGDGTTTSSSSSLSISVARQKRDVKKDKKAKGQLSISPVKPDGWLELITLSTESASYQGCASSQSICDDTCTDTSRDVENCGACGNSCSGSQTCQSGQCTSGSSSSCQSCVSSVSSNQCNTQRAACAADSYCTNLLSCLQNCTNTTCESTCRSTYSLGVTKLNAFDSCLNTYCGSVCN